MDRETSQAAHPRFLDDPGKWDFLVSWARASSCPPVYVDWTNAFGVTIEGAVIAYEHDPAPGRSPEESVVSDLRLLNVALIQGARRYPWLAERIPPRPLDAKDCSMCLDPSAKAVLATKGVICSCGGAGWVPASDAWVNQERLR